MNLKRLTEISPIIGSFLIFIGFLKLYLFYNHWDINISHYLDFSEILLLFLNDINTILFFIVILIFVLTISVATISAIDRRTTFQNQLPPNTNSNTQNNQNPSNNFQGIIPIVDEIFTHNPNYLIVGAGVLTAIFATLFLFFSNITFLYFTFITFSQLVFFVLEKLIGVKNQKALFQISFILILLGFTLCSAKYQAKQVETK